MGQKKDGETITELVENTEGNAEPAETIAPDSYEAFVKKVRELDKTIKFPNMNEWARDAYFKVIGERLETYGPLEIPKEKVIFTKDPNISGHLLITESGIVINDILPNGIHIVGHNGNPEASFGVIRLPINMGEFGNKERVSLAHELSHCIDPNYVGLALWRGESYEKIKSLDIPNEDKVDMACDVNTAHMLIETGAWNNARLIAELLGVPESAFEDTMTISLRTHHLLELQRLKKTLKGLDVREDLPLFVFDPVAQEETCIDYKDFLKATSDIDKRIERSIQEAKQRTYLITED